MYVRRTAYGSSGRGRYLRRPTSIGTSETRNDRCVRVRVHPYSRIFVLGSRAFSAPFGCKTFNAGARPETRHVCAGPCGLGAHKYLMDESALTSSWKCAPRVYPAVFRVPGRLTLGIGRYTVVFTRFVPSRFIKNRNFYPGPYFRTFRRGLSRRFSTFSRSRHPQPPETSPNVKTLNNANGTLSDENMRAFGFVKTKYTAQ